MDRLDSTSASVTSDAVCTVNVSVKVRASVSKEQRVPPGPHASKEPHKKIEHKIDNKRTPP